MSKVIRNVLLGLLFLLFVGLIIWGQKTISYSGLGFMMIGLGGILAMIAVYNHRYK